MNLLGIDFEEWFHPELIQKCIKNTDNELSVVNGIDKILELLRKNDTCATFFMVGELLESKPFAPLTSHDAIFVDSMPRIKYLDEITSYSS
jgi:hypothetical protein